MQPLPALAKASPAYLPDLARALNNLSIRQAETGDRDAALATITEAVRSTALWPQPAPPPTCPTSPRSLNNLTRLSGHLPATVNDDPWQQAIAAFDDPLPRAELRAHYAQALEQRKVRRRSRPAGQCGG